MKQCTDVSLLANVVNMSDTCAKPNQFSPNTISCQYIVASFCQHTLKLLLEKKIIKQCMGENGTLMARIGLRTVQMLNYQMGV